jgi:uncharacterized protein (TIGR02391 family)
VRPFRSADLEAISKVLGDTLTGLTGSEISRLLEECQIPDVSPSITKWKRLFNAFVEEQNRQQYGNHVVAIIHKAMNPVRHADSPDHFALKRRELNLALAFSGLELREDGRLHAVQRAKTITEAQERADRLRSLLATRNVHPEVLRFCDAELLTKNYFHAVLEATKSVAEKIRRLTGLSADGAELATRAFGIGKSGKPLLAINSLSTQTEIGEQRGFTGLLVGLFGTFRNTTAHAPKIYWPISEQDALDILGLVSLVHRKLDNVQK